MADNDAGVDFTIKTKAELGGVEDFVRETERALGKAKALGDNTKIVELTAQLERARRAMELWNGASGNLAKDMGVITVSGEEAARILGKTGEKAEMSHLAMRRLAHALGSEIPGGAAIMESGFASLEGEEGALMGATFLLIAGLEMLRDAIQKVTAEQAEAKRIAGEMADVDKNSIEYIDDQREALDKAEVSESEFYYNFIRNATDAMDVQEKLAASTLKAAAAAGEKNENGRNKIAGQEIEAMEQRGVITHAAAIKMKEQLDEEYQQQQLARMIALDLAEEKLTEHQLKRKKDAAAGLDQAEQTAQQAATAAATAKASNTAKIAAANQKITGAEGVKKELQGKGITDEMIQSIHEAYAKMSGQDAYGKDAASLSDQYNWLAGQDAASGGSLLGLKSLVDWGLGRTGTVHDIVSTLGAGGADELATYEGADLTIKGAKMDLKHAQANAPQLDAAAGNADSDLEVARKAMEHNRDEIRTLQDQLADQQDTNKTKEGGARIDLGQNQASAALGDDRVTADTLAHGGTATNEAMQKMVEDASRIAGHQVDLQTAAQIIENGANNLGMFMQQVSRLATSLGNFNPQQAAQLQQQIDAIETRLTRAQNNMDNF